jgi:2-haloacid dehalogenase
MARSPVETITFDSYTTLVDVGSQEEVLARHVDDLDDPESVSRSWRARNMMYSVIANDIDAYRPFYELLGLSLEFALESHGYEVSEKVRDEIRRTVYKDDLSIYEDVRPGMERLQELGYDMYIVSNGNPEMLDDLVEQADIQDLVQDTISAHEVKSFKPPAEIYRHAAGRTGTPIREILHVSGGTMRDVWGAKHAGMQTAWVNRPSESYPKEQLGKDPDMIVEGFEDLAGRLGGE